MFFRLSSAFALAALVSVPAQSQITTPRVDASVDCASGTTSLAWPADNPVWTLDALPPNRSSGRDGSGLEIRDLRYRGKLVMGRGHAPILNVDYDPGSSCNCYRDWSDSSFRFEVDEVSGTTTACSAGGGAFSFTEADPGSVRTTCETADEFGNYQDVGDYTGIAAEDFGDVLVLTTHYNAGWYRYRVKWYLYEDGRVRPEFTYGHTGNFCTESARNHHVYWRFDFDIEGSESDYIASLDLDGNETVLQTEVAQQYSDASGWVVRDAETGRGYRLSVGAEKGLPIGSQGDHVLPSTERTFAFADVISLKYNDGELDDRFASAPFYCAAAFEYPGDGREAMLNAEGIDGEDVVLWYRTGTRRPGSLANGNGDFFCRILGPTLSPIGEWDTSIDAAPAPADVPERAVLRTYPNPFDQTATVRFEVPEAQRVTVTVYDALGREISVLYTEDMAAGQEEFVQFEAQGLPAGVYTVRLTGTAGLEMSRQIVLTR
jgi:hypothetical protein